MDAASGKYWVRKRIARRVEEQRADLRRAPELCEPMVAQRDADHRLDRDGHQVAAGDRVAHREQVCPYPHSIPG